LGKLRYVTVAVLAAAGFAASFALADEGKHHGNSSCQRSVVFGSSAAPMNLTFTVTKAGKSGLKEGDTATLPVGATGQTVRVLAVGCVGTDGTVTLRNAELHVANPNGHKHDGTTTVTTNAETTTTSDSTSTETVTTAVNTVMKKHGRGRH
jgi:hypothetical protein